MRTFFDKLTVADIRTLDADDALQNRHTLFDLPEGVIYLVGHSLGPASLTALARLNEAAAADWAGDIVGAWNSAGWIDLAEATGDRISRLIGAAPGEVIVCDSVSVNLFKLAAAALPLANRARTIRVEVGEFPTDQYVAEALSGLVGAEFERLEQDAGLNALKAGGVLIKSAVNFRSGEIADIAAHEAEAAKSGALIVWDLSHATGVVDVRLGDAGAKLAAGCTYKYVNGGPGAPAFIYASADIVSRLETPLPGWMGHAMPFAFENAYTPREGVARFAAGTPPILSLAALAGALDAFDEVDVAALARKAGVLGDLVIARADAIGLEVTSPRDAKRRGGHVSLRVSEGYPVVQALAAAGVRTDFRTPDTVRIGCSPLFLSHMDIWNAMNTLEDILTRRSWDQPQFHQRAKVT